MSSKNFYGLTGDVTVDGGILNVGSAQLYANTETSNVGIGTTNPLHELHVIGDANVENLYATFLHGDGSNIENIVSSQWEGAPGDPIYYTSNVGIANTTPVTKTLQVGSNLYVEDAGSNVIHVTGNVYADYFVGDGSQLTGIAASLDQIVDQGNLVSNTIQLISGQDPVSNVGLVTHEGVSISVSNTNPTGEYQFGVGSNLLVNVYSSNVVTVSGNVLAEKMTLGTITVRPSYNLSHVTAEGGATGDTISLTNATTGLSATANVLVGGELDVEGNVHVGERLKFDSNVFVDSLRVADLAANLVTYDATTGELMDSAGLFANKLAVVSEQPPVALTGASTSVSGHGTYTIEASSGTVTHLFDKDNATVWQTGATYNDDGVYVGSNTLAGTGGEWAKITFPYKTILRHVKFESTNSSIKDLTIVGLNDDGTTWTTLKNVTNLSSANSTIIVDASTRHATYGFIVTATNVGKTQAEIGDLRLFTESFSIDGGKVDMTVSSISTITANLEVGTANLFVDTTTGRVGIGKTDPGSALDVVGETKVSSNLEVGTANLFVDTQTGRVGIGKTDPSSALDVVGETKVSSNLEVGTANLFVDTQTGRVGVGVNNPKESLDIRGNMHLTRVSNVSQISVDSNVVAEYTGPHDRPLRKYPEVNFLGDGDLTQFGYTASSSGQFNPPNYPASNAFTGSASTTPNAWVSPDGTFEITQTNNGSIANSSNVFTGAPSGEQNGPWLKIELPKAIKLSHSKIYRWHASGYDTRLKDGYIYGSNDDSTYTRLVRLNNLGTSWDQYTGATINVNATEHYKYYVLHVREIYQTDNTSATASPYVTLGEWELYGYEEGSGSLDTTLKSVYNVPATTGTQLEVYYDAKGESTVQSPIPDLSPNTNTGAVSGHSPTLDSTDGIDSFKFNGSSQYVTGAHGLTTGSDPVHTISLWFKRIAKVGQFEYLVQLGQGGTSHQQSAIFLHDDKIAHGHWGGGVYHTDVITDNVWYHIAATYTGGNTSDLSTHKIYVNGVEIGIDAYSSDGPLVLTGTALTLGRNEDALGSPGGYFNGSIANFRLYSKALNADQVKELYDYQKDYFLGSKSQVTLYKGHLGVGVTEPSGQLELAGDERIQEYPPGPMDDYDTHIPGHGVFTVSASSEYNNTDLIAYNAFNKITTSGTNPWISDGNPDTFDEITGLASTANSFEGTSGPWIKLELPYNVKPKKVQMFMRTTSESTSARRPKSGIVYGRKDGVYHQITNFDFGSTDKDIPLEELNLNTRDFYSEFVLQITSMYLTGASTDAIAIKGINYFGTPGPTTLDKGSLTLGRSLDVPRISRYDVDTETPRPEKLVVDFDTTVNSSPTDISGRGNHGTLVGATYSPADKAFSFDGGDYIQGSLTNSSNFTNTVSLWFKMDEQQSTLGDPGTTGNRRTIFEYGPNRNTNLQYAFVDIRVTYMTIYMGDAFNLPSSAFAPQQNQWHHFVLMYSGSGTIRVFIDNVEYTSSLTSNSTGTLALPTNTQLLIGSESRLNAAKFRGDISNFKVYNVALEPSEVQKLYRLGRTGRSMVISDTAVGIGKVPEAQLDVRGTARFDHAEATDTLACNSLAYGISQNLVTPRDHTCLAQRQVARGNSPALTFKVNYLTSWVPGILTLTGSTTNTDSSSFVGHYAVLAYRRLSSTGNMVINTMFSQNTAGNSVNTTVNGNGKFNIVYNSGGPGSQDTIQITYSGNGARDVFVAECVEYSRLYY
jgi:hypothetical protein